MYHLPHPLSPTPYAHSPPPALPQIQNQATAVWAGDGRQYPASIASISTNNVITVNWEASHSDVPAAHVSRDGIACADADDSECGFDLFGFLSADIFAGVLDSFKVNGIFYDGHVMPRSVKPTSRVGWSWGGGVPDESWKLCTTSIPQASEAFLGGRPGLHLADFEWNSTYGLEMRREDLYKNYSGAGVTNIHVKGNHWW